MAETTEYASYLVRIWWEESEKKTATTPKWRAEVESIQTGETLHLSELTELTRFFHMQTMGREKP
jgi:hypothetical protein